MSRQCRSKVELIQLGSAHEKYGVWTRPELGLSPEIFFGLICTSATITSSFKLKITYFIETANLAPVVQKWDSTIHLINLYPEDNAIGFYNT